MGTNDLLENVDENLSEITEVTPEIVTEEVMEADVAELEENQLFQEESEDMNEQIDPDKIARKKSPKAKKVKTPKVKKITGDKKEKAPKKPGKAKSKKKPAFIAKLTKTKAYQRIRYAFKEVIFAGSDKSLKVTKQIKFRLVVSFMVPVILIVVLGVISYEKAKSTIVSNYEKTSLTTMISSSDYVGLLMSDIASRADQLVVDNTFTYYFSKFEENDDATNNEYFSNIKTNIQMLTSSSVGINMATAVGELGRLISTNINSSMSLTYNDYLASDEGKFWTDNKNTTKAWFGTHTYIDEACNIIPDTYAASYIRRFTQGSGFVIFDLKRSVVEKSLNSAIVSDGSISAFVTEDGREVLVGGKKAYTTSSENLIVGQDFYTKAFESEEASGSKYVQFNGSKALFVYSKVGDTGTMICGLIPQADVLREVAPIKWITIIFVVLSTLIALFIGLYTAGGIAKATGEFTSSFKRVAKGDLTTDLNLKRQDEFGVMADRTNEMISKIRSLVVNVAGFGRNVTDAATEVSESSTKILGSIKDVSVAMEEMENGVTSQVQDAENGYREMEVFAERINQVTSSTELIGKVADNTKVIVEDGKEIVNHLKEQSESTAQITGNIISDIKELERKSSDIGQVVNTINGIAKQTNLLSLNASIEAARAGVAGLGFAVVAEEIRKLAEQSVAAVKDIESIIANVLEQTKKTAVNASSAGAMLKDQSEALNNTVEVFSKVDNQFDELVDKISSIMTNMQELSEGKIVVLDSIKNIAAVTEETNASASTVRETVDLQLKSVENLSARAEELTEKAKELEQAIEIFKI